MACSPIHRRRGSPSSKSESPQRCSVDFSGSSLGQSHPSASGEPERRSCIGCAPGSSSRPDCAAMERPEQLLDDARVWLAQDPDPETSAALAGLIDGAEDSDLHAWAHLAELFAGRLAFGTAGLRGELGPGPMRMNRVLGASGRGRSRPVAGAGPVGGDRFRRPPALRPVRGRLGPGPGRGRLRVRLFPGTCPTPVLAYAIRSLAADAGIMCTASHNPASDNGCKIYLGDGAQIIPPADAEIAAAIEAVSAGGAIALADAADAAIEPIGPDVAEAYLDHVVGLVEPGPRAIRIVYTPLHGVAGFVAREAFWRAGFADVHEVASQAVPDPGFPTLAFPNPEEAGALDRAEALAREVGADLVLAHDPDGDRLGVMLADGAGGFAPLTGNQIGALLGRGCWRRRAATTASWSPPSCRRTCWPAWPRPRASTTPRCPRASSGWSVPVSNGKTSVSCSDSRRRWASRSTRRCATRTGSARRCASPSSPPRPGPRVGRSGTSWRSWPVTTASTPPAPGRGGSRAPTADTTSPR